MSARPKASIGLPVYNGERYVEEAIRSILGQTYDDFELIISDNASTDDTEAVCRAYAAQDRRIRYSRNAKNIGLIPNFNRVFGLASGEYFRWAGHDDVCLPEHLARCIEALDEDRAIVISYCRGINIDENGSPMRRRDSRPAFSSASAHIRFRESLVVAEPDPLQCGVIRTEVLRRIPLMGTYPVADLTFLAELSLHGRFHEVPEFLFLHRDHPGRSMRAHDWRNPHSDITWLDPRNAGKVIFPQWRLFGNHVSAIARAPIGVREQVRCYAHLARWLGEYRHELFRDLVMAGGRVPGLGPGVRTAHTAYVQASWNKRLRRAIKEIKRVVPMGHDFILVDEGLFGLNSLDERRASPFMERNGQFWGPPADDAIAIQELDRQRLAGARFIVFGWPCFWWLESYSGFHRHLRSNFHCALSTSRVLVFDLWSTEPQLGGATTRRDHDG